MTSSTLVKKDQDSVLLQKSAPSGLLSSKQYWVPNNRVFPILSSKKEVIKDAAGPQSDSSDSSDSDLISVTGLDCNHPDSDPETARPAVETQQPSRRSNRNRSKPQRYGVAVDEQDPIDSVDELIPSWYPGWNKEDTRNYIMRDNDL